VRALSVIVHFDAMARGVLDTRDLLYCASGSVSSWARAWRF